MPARRHTVSDHHVERHGVCAYCFEEWPCAVARGEKKSSGIQEHSNDEILAEHLAESQRRLDRNRHTTTLLRNAGFDFEVVDFAVGVMIDTTLLHDIAVRLSENEVL